MSEGGERRYHPFTRLIHGRMHSAHWQYDDHIVPPISSSAAYRLESAQRGAEGFVEFANPEFNVDQHAPIYIYDRLDEPARGMLEENLAQAEGGDKCACFATGMAAISAALGIVSKTGDRIVAHPALYGCTYSLFTNWYPRYGIDVDFVDMHDLAAVERALEPAEHDGRVLRDAREPDARDHRHRGDRGASCKRANARRPDRKRRIFLVVDNTFATPFSQRPLEQGADIVVHSLTKNIGGFGTDMGGAVICEDLIYPDLLLYRKDFGGPLSPKSAWPVLTHGLPTLPVRVPAPAGDGAEGRGVPRAAPGRRARRLPGSGLAPGAGGRQASDADSGRRLRAGHPRLLRAEGHARGGPRAGARG